MSVFSCPKALIFGLLAQCSPPPFYRWEPTALQPLPPFAVCSITPTPHKIQYPLPGKHTSQAPHLYRYPLDVKSTPPPPPHPPSQAHLYLGRGILQLLLHVTQAAVVGAQRQLQRGGRQALLEHLALHKACLQPAQQQHSRRSMWWCCAICVWLLACVFARLPAHDTSLFREWGTVHCKAQHQTL